MPAWASLCKDPAWLPESGFTFLLLSKAFSLLIFLVSLHQASVFLPLWTGCLRMLTRSLEGRALEMGMLRAAWPQEQGSPPFASISLPEAAHLVTSVTPSAAPLHTWPARSQKGVFRSPYQGTLLTGHLWPHLSLMSLTMVPPSQSSA